MIDIERTRLDDELRAVRDAFTNSATDALTVAIYLEDALCITIPEESLAHLADPTATRRVLDDLVAE